MAKNDDDDDAMPELPLPYRVDPRLQIWVRGRWRKGGVIEFYVDDRFVDLIDLPPAKWCLVGLLVHAARSASWSRARAFLSAAELSRELAKRTGRGNADPGNLVRTIHKLRSMLGASAVRKSLAKSALTPLEFGNELIEYHDYLGYRISLPAENLHLEVVDEPTPGADQGG